MGRHRCGHRGAPTTALSLRLSVGEQGLRTEVRPAKEPYLSLTGQELAPGLSGLVAVASSGLFPQPLWISAAAKRHVRKKKRTERHSTLDDHFATDDSSASLQFENGSRS